MIFSKAMVCILYALSVSRNPALPEVADARERAARLKDQKKTFK
jgi:hypothetical protein